MEQVPGDWHAWKEREKKWGGGVGVGWGGVGGGGGYDQHQDLNCLKGY